MLQRPAANTSLHLTERERTNLRRLVDYSSIQSLPEIWPLAQQHFGETIALKDPHAKPEVTISYAQLVQQIQQFAAGLQALGVQPDVGAEMPPRVALFADNSPRWMIADQGIMTAGAANVVRSSQAEREELLFILENSGSTALVVEDHKTLRKLRDRLTNLPIKLVVLLSDEEPDASDLKVLNFKTLLTVGSNHSLQAPTQNRNTLATLMYTSGTSGKPKGVMLTHGNLLQQITTLGAVVPPQPGDRVLSILPSWHAYERTVEYYILSQGCTQIYTSIRHFKQDLQEFKPHLMVAVPRLWESVYEGVQKQFRQQSANQQQLVKFLLANSQRYVEARRIVQGLTLTPQLPTLPQRMFAGMQAIACWPLHTLGEQLVYKKVREATGGQMKYAITGGGSLAMHLDTFFEIIGFTILMGYGLTETSPVTNARRTWRNLRGSSGQPIPGTEIRIVDLETRHPLPVGQRGLVLVRGPQVMQGYLDAEATAQVIDSEGWFNTGDLGWVTPENDLVLTGRAKDTIVLTNGENIEPQPIEDACMRSPYIDQIMVVGQDQRSLGALIVPNLEALQGVGGAELEVRSSEGRSEERVRGSEVEGREIEVTKEIDLESKIIQDLFRQELNREVQNRPGYRPDDRIGPFRLILEPFSIENGMLTQTLKIRRPVVMERYHDIINGIFA